MKSSEEILEEAGTLFEKNQYQEIIDLLTDDLLEQYNLYTLYFMCSLANRLLNQLKPALKYVNKAIELNQTFAEAYGYRGVIYFDDNEYYKAIDDYSKAIELDEHISFIFFNRGLAWYEIEENEKAIEDYNKAIELDEKDSFIYFNRGIAWYEIGENKKAIDDYNKAIELGENGSRIYFNRGLAQFEIEEYEKSIEDYNKAIELDGNSSFVYFYRGLVQFEIEEYEKSIEDYNKAIELGENGSLVYFNRGLAWFEIEENEKAIEDYTKAIELGGNSSLVYFKRGLVWQEKEEHNKAILDFDKTISLDKKNAEPYLCKANSWFYLKEFDKALLDCDNAILVNESYANAYLGKSDIYFAKREYEKAIENYERAIQLDSNDKYIEKRIKLAQEKLEERKALNESGALTEDIIDIENTENEIDYLVEEIRFVAQSEVESVVHYTKMTVAEIYIKRNNTKMHYSNAIYMNDPMEGKLLLDYIHDSEIKEAYQNGEKLTETSIYLGSFLPADDSDGNLSNEDELVMWRTYGKDEQGKDAAGCSIVINSEFFKRNEKIEDSLTTNKRIDDEDLLNVIYIKKQKEGYTIINDYEGEYLKNIIEELKKQLRDLILIKNKYEESSATAKIIDSIIFKKLSGISYLFKSSDYSFEQEVRVITYMPRDSDAIKCRKVDAPNTPNVLYIESMNNVLPYIKKIYLGPKVEHPQRWSLYFDYEIRQRAKEAQQSPDTLRKEAEELRKKADFLTLEAETLAQKPATPATPFEIEIVKSECKFQ